MRCLERGQRVRGQVSKMRSLTNQFWHNYSLYSRTWMYNIPTQISSWGRIPHDMQGGTPFLNHQPSTPHGVQNVPVSLEHRVFGTTRVLCVARDNTGGYKYVASTSHQCCSPHTPSRMNSLPSTDTKNSEGDRSCLF